MNAYAKPYIKWYGKHNQKRILTYIGILFIVLVIPSLMMKVEPKDTHMPLEWACILVALLDGGSAICLSVLQFRFIMKKRACDLYLPLPMKKKTMFILQYGLGIGILVLPNIIFFLAVACEPMAWKFIPYYLVLMSGLALLFISFYSVLVFFVCKCNAIWDAVCAVIGVSLGQFLLVSTLTDMLNTVVNAVLKSTNYNIAAEFFPISLSSSFLSPFFAGIIWTSSLTNAVELGNGGGSIWQNWLIQGDVPPIVFAFYMALGIAAFFGAIHTYEHRKGEDSEQKTTSKWIYPLLILVITGCLILQNMFVSYFWITIIVYLILNFLSERKITIRLSMILYFIGMVLVANGISYVLIKTDGFHLIHEFYEREEIAEVGVTFQVYDGLAIREELHLNEDEENDVTFLLNVKEPISDPTFIDAVTEYQKEVVDSENEEYPSGYIEIMYYLKDGKIVIRTYQLYDNHMDGAYDLIKYILSHQYVEPNSVF